MDSKAKDEYLYDLYYNKKYMSGRDSLFNHNQLNTQRKPATNVRPIITNRPGAMLQMDLIDFSNKPSNGYRYILNVIDTFSRKWLNEIKKKDIKSVIPALNNIIEDIEKDYKVRTIQSDNGPEFNISFPNIKHIQSRPYTPQQQASTRWTQ